MKKKLTIAILSSALFAGTAIAQQQQPGPDAGGPAPGQFNFAEMKQRMLEDMQDQMGMSFDEFKAIQPKIEKIMQLQRETAGRGGPPQGGPGGPGGPQNREPQSDVQTKRQELQTTVENNDSKSAEIKTSVDALRAALTKAKGDLKVVQDDLRSVLTQRQEAILIIRGLLD